MAHAPARLQYAILLRRFTRTLAVSILVLWIAGGFWTFGLTREANGRVMTVSVSNTSLNYSNAFACFPDLDLARTGSSRWTWFFQRDSTMSARDFLCPGFHFAIDDEAHVQIPLILLALPSGIALVWCWKTGIPRQHSQTCSECGYSLGGLVSGQCPECGATIENSEG